MHAARNIALCTKDCLCLFVCPTGATDTENGQIDFNWCHDGCRLCVEACPSHDLYLFFDSYPTPKSPDKTVQEGLQTLLESKSLLERIAKQTGEKAESQAEKRLAAALASSSRILAEDCAREGGFLMLESSAVNILLRQLLEENRYTADFPQESCKKLLELLESQ